jgi:hypothetical protein
MKDSLEQCGDLSPDNSADEEVKTFVTRGIIPGPLPVRRSEEEAVKTTIVGARPPTSGRSQGSIPHGIEVLIKKASVDPSFRGRLLEKRAEAAREIGLELSPAEVAAINAVPPAQLEQIIASTRVPEMQRRAFLGQVGAAMLAALTIGLSGCETQTPTLAPPTPSPREKVVEKGVVKEVVEGIIDTRVESERVDSATVLVNYTSTFGKGEIVIDFRRDPATVGADLTYQPSQTIAVSPGKGTVTFHVSGSGETTNWLITGLRSTTPSCAGSAGLLPPNEYQDRRYVRDECAIWRIMEYRKDWTPKE